MGFDPPGSDARIGFCRKDVGFEGTRSLDLPLVVGGAASTLAADAAVGAVAEPGSRTVRVGDFGRGFVNEGGDVGPGFFPGFCASFADGTGAFGGADGRLGLSAVVFLVSSGISFFDCVEAGIFGDIFVESGCFVGVAVSLGVMGAGSGEV